MTEVYGLLGRDISYSRSPEIHRVLWGKDIEDRDYLLFDTKNLIAFVGRAKAMSDLRGFNVTIPYKQAIIPYLDELEGDALATRAVNTVKCLPSGRWIGYNTDVIGFETLIGGMDLDPSSEIYILGTGGASKAVVRALEKRGRALILISRHPQEGVLCYEDLPTLLSTTFPKVIVNTTPLGSHQLPDQLPPIPYSLLTSEDTLIDLIYSPEETPFMKEGQKVGAKVSNGLTMLWEQARAAQAIWAR
ncbi:shikimate dehydrogenase family protein [Porphyromonas cangingivalis]|uniref:Shikimate dehydrogenase n=1 Tax=Porphyromonas cangingivalis TaxID=36874 RepID=A0A1T4JMM0_PORCN|nr:shikimate dehydrogenase [Porphyromonas cangingivalis]SJZ31439.1 shikimate dehydrogenase [Porphyromonas cangingivalis]VEJ04422.1 Shikimate dehydrogenase [Porphyromonas cangingivalis]